MQKVKLNIVPKGVKKTTYLSQNDNGRVVRYELFNELIPYILDGSETITLKVVRPDGEEILANIENTFEGEAYIDVSFNDDMSAITGVGAGEIKITDGETELGSHNFDINVEIDAYNGKDVVIETETGTLLSFNTEVEDNALEYESEIPYNAEGYTDLRVINSRTAPVYDKTPYLFRKTPDGSGNSCIEKLNGLTVAFNQLVQNGNFESTSYWSASDSIISASDNVLSCSFSSSNYARFFHSTIQVTSGHKYIVMFICKSDSAGSGKTIYCPYTSTPLTYASVNTFVINETWKLCASIFTPNSTASAYIGSGKTGYSTEFTAQYKNFMLFDLTQMFGSTIADYIYSLETAQAGAGVAYFKNLFGADYYAYNTGELISVKTSGRKTVGNNVLPLKDGSYTVNNVTIVVSNGRIIANGTATSGGGRLVKLSENFILRAGTYFINGYISVGGLTPYINDASNNQTINSGDYRSFTIDKDTEVFCGFNVTNGQTYNNAQGSPMLNFGESTMAFEPYNAVTYPLDPDLELRGIPKLDANNKLYGDGDIYESSGDVTRRYGIITLGTGFAKDGNNRYYKRLGADFNVKVFSGNEIANAICEHYIAISPNKYNGRSLSGITITTSLSQPTIFIYDANYDDTAANFDNLIKDYKLVYELATPTSESADPFTDPQEARITEEFIDTREIPIPVAQDSIYGTDIEYQDIDFNTTIYGGEIDSVNGVLSSEYNSDGSVKPTPEIIDITPTPIPVRAGDNKIFNTANGNQTIRYYNQVEE